MNASRVRIVAIILIVVGVGVFLVNMFWGTASKKQDSVVTSPTPTDFPFPTDTPTPTLVASPSASITVKPTIATTEKTTGLDKSALTVDVQNGGGVVGAASKMAETLRSFGYTVGTIGNAPSYEYLDVTISVKSTKSTYLPILKKDLSTSYAIASSSATLSASSSADAVVIVGK